MLLFKRKKNQVDVSASNSGGDDNFKSVTESLYKQNLELAVKNKTLSLLGKLYEISILALEPKELSEKIDDVIREDFSFELVGIMLYNSEKKELEPLSFSESERFKGVCSEFSTILDSTFIPNVTENFFKDIVVDKKMSSTTELKDIWGSLVKDEVFKKMKAEGHVLSSICYPLIIEDRVIGVLLLSLNRLYENLATYEKEAISSFINVISVALDKAMLYMELTNTNIKLKEANQGQASLMHFMNHQIKGRLGNAKNIFAELLTSDYGEIPEFAKPLLQKGLDETNTGVNYVQNILKGASAENGTLPYDMKLLNFETVVKEAFEKQKDIAEKKELEFKLTIEPNDYGFVGDSLELGEAIRNLIDNSINYTPKGSISVKLSRSQKAIRLEIKDTGVGIAKGDMDKLFKSGGRGTDSLKVNTNSTGYGLVFVKGVIEAHKGKVWVESEGCDHGSTFFVELPK